MKDTTPNMDEAASLFVAKLSANDKAAGQIALGRFTAWYGHKKLMSKLTAPIVADYSNRLSPAATNYQKTLKLLRAFLTRAKKEGWIEQGLSGHLKARRSVRPRAAAVTPQAKGDSMSPEIYKSIEVEIAELNEKRLEVVKEISRAAADKDFRENAPLAAAKEQCGHIEGRIKELKETLKTAVIIDANAARETSCATVGDTVWLKDPNSGKEVCYTLVNPREVNVSQGKISNVSPIGQAIIGKEAGAVVEITVPAGKLCYRVERVGR